MKENIVIVLALSACLVLLVSGFVKSLAVADAKHKAARPELYCPTCGKLK